MSLINARLTLHTLAVNNFKVTSSIYYRENFVIIGCEQFKILVMHILKLSAPNIIYLGMTVDINFNNCSIIIFIRF